MQKLLSIVIPVYNVEQYLNRCIESVVKQTYKKLEIIIVDDGSPDNCPCMCDEWMKKDPRIKVIHKKNGGLSDARNCGIENSTGEYIAFVDSDDFIEKEMYSIMIEAMERTDSEIATCGRYMFKNGKKSKKYVFDTECILDTYQALNELLCGGLIEEASWDKVYKRECFRNIRFPVGEINEDMPIMPYLIETAKKIVCTGKPLYYYCENPESITHSDYNCSKSIVIKHITSVSKYLKEKYPKLENAVAEFEGRYASGMLPFFEKKPELKKIYADDYKFYKNYAKSSFMILMKSKYRSKTEKTELFLALIGIYRPIWLLKNMQRRR